ncbi:MAG: 2-oxoacid:acceptor oxidoreductase family protein [Burkholderiales bacterium]
MYRIRFHGRGGQGMKTASRLLGSAFFEEGFEVQDAPRYGAERRGAPIFAYVRADRQPILERGLIRRPGLVIVADDSLVAMPAAGVLADVGERTVLLVNTLEPAEEWRSRLNYPGPLLVLPAPPEARHVGAACAGAAARLAGCISPAALAAAIRGELAAMAPAVVEQNLAQAHAAYAAMADHAGCVPDDAPLAASGYRPPEWIDLPLDDARIAGPTVHAAATSVEVRTGLWRTLRPVVDYARCNRCWWVCSSFCPDGAIDVSADGYPRIDYEHCKGCLVCVGQCPAHAIEAVPEHLAQQREQQP